MNKASLNLADSVKRMTDNGMSQRQIAAALGISQSSVSRLAKYDPAQEATSLTAMIEEENKCRAAREEAFSAFHGAQESVI